MSNRMLRMLAMCAAPRASILLGCLVGGSDAGYAVAGAGPIQQLNYFATGFDEFGVPLEVPSIDPSDITFHEPSGHLFIVDSEINEVSAVFNLVGANVFEISPNGDTLYAGYDLTALGNLEPTGITYNAFDGFFYVTNDNTVTITRYAFSPVSGFSLEDEVDYFATSGADDPEGITSDPATGLLYVANGGDAKIVVYSHGKGGFALQGVFDLADLNPAAGTPADPEGIAFDVGTGHLFVVSRPEEALFEFTTAGIFVARYDMAQFVPAPIALQGAAFAPTSDAGDNPLRRALYIVDGGIDNNDDPAERDGAVYEALVGRDPCGNGSVDPGESCANCPADVPCPPGTACAEGVCVDLCGNGRVDHGEDCATCPADVQCPPGTVCLDGVCDRLCGNGAVDPGEDCANCPADVPCAPGEACVSPPPSLMAGTSPPAICVEECPWDMEDNGLVNAADLLTLFLLWGTDPGGPPDFDGDGDVNTEDLLALLGAWGTCP